MFSTSVSAQPATTAIDTAPPVLNPNAENLGRAVVAWCKANKITCLSIPQWKLVLEFQTKANAYDVEVINRKKAEQERDEANGGQEAALRLYGVGQARNEELVREAYRARVTGYIYAGIAFAVGILVGGATYHFFIRPDDSPDS